MTRPGRAAASAQPPVPPPDPVIGLDWLLVALLVVVAAGAAVLGILLVPLYVGSDIVPVSVVMAIAVNLVAPRLGFGLVQAASGAVLPLVAWLIPTLGLVLYARPEGDVLVAGVTAQEWVLYATILAGAGSGFWSVVAATGAAAPLPPAARPGQSAGSSVRVR